LPLLLTILMMIIDFLAGAPDRSGRYTVRFSDGTSMRLYRQTVEDFSLYSGMELSDGVMKSLINAAAEMSAKMRAIRIVSATNVSEWDLQQRLIHKGEDPEQAKNAVSWMAELDLVDDRKTARQIVDRCISKGYGAARAKQVLYEKMIPKNLWDEVLADYPDQSDAIMDYLESKLSEESDQRDIRRVVDALIRRGHNYSAIRRCLDKIALSNNDFREETYG